MPYRHTQRGTFTLIVCLLFAAIDALIAWRSGQWSPVVVLIVTLEVGDNELRWHFGPGLWTYRLWHPDGAGLSALQRVRSRCRRRSAFVARENRCPLFRIML
jgi:hypothetical protein